jgi:YVTN family beta-propeller protein
LYVSNGSIDGVVSGVDTLKEAVVAEIPVGMDPRGLAVDGYRDRIYVANHGDATVSIIDGESNAVVDTVNVGIGPQAIAIVHGATCPGDCDGSGRVTVNELLVGVEIALGRKPMDECPEVDTDGDDHCTVSELVAAVSAALSGCR